MPLCPSILCRWPSKMFSRNSSPRDISATSRQSSNHILDPHEPLHTPEFTCPIAERPEQLTQKHADTVKAAGDYERKNPLLDLDLLDVKEEDRKWFRNVNIAVRDIMNGPKYDVSHNYQHARRVVANGKYILEQESKHHQWARDIDPLTVYLGCLVHDIGDRKYREANEERGQCAIVTDFLIEHGVPSLTSRLVAHLVSHVSFTLEMHSREAIAAVAKEHPAFRIIQDADRLDGLGTIGVARMLIYRGVDDKLRHESIDSDIELVEGRFSHYPELMKTKTGRKIAKKRYQWMVDVWLPPFRKETIVRRV